MSNDNKDLKQDIEMIGDDDIEIITLYDEDRGKEIDFEEIAAVEYNEKLYVILAPIEPDDDIEEGEVIIMEVAEENGEEILVNIKDEALLDQVFEEFQKQMEMLGDDDEGCEEGCCGCGKGACGDEDEGCEEEE